MFTGSATAIEDHDALVTETRLTMAESRRTCASCGTPNEEDARFCEGCGASLARICATCGVEANATARFCRGCGAALDGQVAARGRSRPRVRCARR